MNISKICTLIGFFCAKYIAVDLKKYRGIILHDTEEWCKIWRKTDLWFGKWGIWQIFSRALESVRIGTLMTSLYPILKMHGLKLYRGVMCVDTEEWWKIWRGIDLSFQDWQILTQALENLKNFHFNGLLLSKIYIALAKKVQRSYLSWHWRVMQNLKKNWLVVWKMTWGIWQIFTRALESLKIGTLMGSFYPK